MLLGAYVAPKELDEFMKSVTLAEQCGFDRVWVPDSQMIWREAYVILGAAAAVTKHIKLGTGVTNPVTRDLGVLAASWATLRESVGDRLLLGIGTGDSSLETIGKKPATLANFEQSDRLLLGGDAQLGLGTYVGDRVYSINDKICVLIVARDLEQYRQFLPRGELFDQLTDLVFFHIGHRFEFDVRLSLPARHAPPTRLGESGELGWTAWVTPDNEAGLDVYFDDAHFNALERRRAQREAKRAGRAQ